MMNNREVAAQFLTGRQVTLWQSWDLTSPESHAQAVEWLTGVLDECAVIRAADVSDRIPPELRGTHADRTAGHLGQPVPYRPIGLTINTQPKTITENGMVIAADGHSYRSDAGW